MVSNVDRCGQGIGIGCGICVLYQVQVRYMVRNNIIVLVEITCI